MATLIYQTRRVKGTCYIKATEDICDTLRDLVPSVQFEKREKAPCRSVTFRKVAGFIL